MAKKVVVWVVAVLVGTVVGMCVMMALHRASALVYPIPPGLDLMSQDPAQQALMKAWFATLPAGAFVMATAAHGLGCLSGAVLATLIVRRRSIVPAILVGAGFTVAGIMNLAEIPHPAWFAFVDLPIYLAPAALVARLLTRMNPPPTA